MSDQNEGLDSSAINDQLVMITGFPSTGKSASLEAIPNQERVLYCNTESGKRLPFRSKFMEQKIVDPTTVYDLFQQCIDNPELVDGAIVDSLTFLMDLVESHYVINTNNTQKGWQNFQQYFKRLMQYYVPIFPGFVIFTAHLKEVYDASTQEMRTMVPVKGSLKENGLEAYFSTIVEARTLPIKALEGIESDLLTITDEEREIGYKHVFQTRKTKDTVGTRIRSPMRMFAPNEVFMDNNTHLLLQRLKAFYG